MEVVQLLGSQGFWQHQVLRGVGGQGSTKYSALEGYGNQYWPVRSRILPWRTPSPDKEAWQTSVQGCKESDTTEASLHTSTQDFLCPWQLCPSELSVKVAQLLGLQGPKGRQMCRNTDCLCHRSYGPISLFSSLLFFFFKSLVAGDQKASLFFYFFFNFILFLNFT